MPKLGTYYAESPDLVNRLKQSLDDAVAECQGFFIRRLTKLDEEKEDQASKKILKVISALLHTIEKCMSAERFKNEFIRKYEKERFRALRKKRLEEEYKNANGAEYSNNE